MTSRRRLYTGLPQTQRLLHVPEDVDHAYQRLAGEEGVTVNSLYNVAALAYLDYRAKAGTGMAALADQGAVAASYASSPVHAAFDSYGQIAASVTDAFEETRSKLSGKKQPTKRATKGT